jgi:long-chain-fatty-acid--CoA ligase ACSBG
MFEWAQKVSTEQITAQFKQQTGGSLEFSLAKLLVLNKIHRELGLEQCRHFYSGAAPITKDTLDFFISIGIPLCEVYGMSEATGPHSHGLFSINRACSIGPVRQLNRSKLLQREEDGSGELAVYGRHVFMGYLNDEKKTLEAFDDEGWCV